MPTDTPILWVCNTCRAGMPLAEGEVPPGAHLHAALARLVDAAGEAAPVQLRPVQCLSVCSQGCAVAIQAPGKWGYLLGGLTVGHAADLLAYGATYAGSKTGTVLPSRRPASLAQPALGRIPALPLPVLPLPELAS